MGHVLDDPNPCLHPPKVHRYSALPFYWSTRAWRGFPQGSPPDSGPTGGCGPGPVMQPLTPMTALRGPGQDGHGPSPARSDPGAPPPESRRPPVGRWSGMMAGRVVACTLVLVTGLALPVGIASAGASTTAAPAGRSPLCGERGDRRGHRCRRKCVSNRLGRQLGGRDHMPRRKFLRVGRDKLDLRPRRRHHRHHRVRRSAIARR